MEHKRIDWNGVVTLVFVCVAVLAGVFLLYFIASIPFKRTTFDVSRFEIVVGGYEYYTNEYFIKDQCLSFVSNDGIFADSHTSTMKVCGSYSIIELSH